MSNGSQSKLSIDDLASGIDHEPTKEWLNENKDTVQTTFDAIQTNITDYNKIAAVYNTRNINASLGLEPLEIIEKEFTTDNIRGTFANFTDSSGFSSQVESVTAQITTSLNAAADLGAEVFDDEGGDRAAARKDLSEMRAKATALQRNTETMAALNEGYLKATEKYGTFAEAIADNTPDSKFARELFGVQDEFEARKKRLEDAQSEGLGGFVPTENAVGTVFQEQCFLQAKVFDIVKYRKDFYSDANNKSLPYVETPSNVKTNSSLLVEGQPFAVVNKLTQYSGFSTMFELPPEILSQLQPMVRLYKIISTAGGKSEDEIEIKFPVTDETAKITDAFKNTAKRGLGVGLKSFDYSYEGSDPFALKKSIKATLRIHATSFDDLLAPRGPRGRQYSYADLALKTGSDLMEQNINSDPSMSDTIIDNVNKLKFRLKAVVGYQVPPNLQLGRYQGARSDVLNAIYNSYTTLNLTPTIHEFDFDDTGRVAFTVNYLAYIEDYFDDGFFNIFSLPEFIKSTEELPSIYSRKLQMKNLEKNCQFEDLKKLKDDKEYGKAKHLQAMQSLLKPLFQKNLLRYVNLSYIDLLAFNKQGSGYDLTKNLQIGSTDAEGNIKLKQEVDKAIADNADGDQTDDVFGLREAGGEQFRQVSFFFFSDLVDTILENMDISLRTTYSEELGRLLQRGIIDKDTAFSEIKRVHRSYENFKKLRILLGPMELQDKRSPGNAMVASIGDIPISTKYFIEYMTSKLLSKNFFTYSLSTFINEFVKSYIRNFLNTDECFGGEDRQRISFFNSSVTSYKDASSDHDEITQLITEQGALHRLNIDKIGPANFPILNVGGTRDSPVPSNGQRREVNYMIFYAGRSQPKNLMSGKLVQDRNNGIQHYILGRDVGIVKNIQLQKTTSPNLRTVRFEQEGYDGFQQLREVYDATIDTFLAPNTFPGTYIFVDPRGFAPNSKEFTSKTKFDKFEISKYGVGGYYMITKSEHSITSEGVRETKITAKWVAQLDKERRINSKSKKKAEIDSNPDLTQTQKCKLKKSLDTSMRPQSTPQDTVGVATN